MVDNVDTSDYLNWTNYKRVLKVAETPDWDEFSKILGITSVGIALLGTIGYLMYVIVFVLPGGV